MWFIFLLTLTTAITQLDDNNFDDITLSVQNKTHEEWFVLIHGENEQSEHLLQVWDDLERKLAEEKITLNLGKIDYDQVDGLRQRLTLKLSPQTLYLKSGRAWNITMYTLDDAMTVINDPSRITTYKNRKIKMTDNWFKRLVIIWDKYILKKIEQNAFVLILFLFGIVGVCVGITLVAGNKVLKGKID